MMIIRSARSMGAWLGFAATAFLAQGCTQSNAPAWSGIYGIDTQGAAKTCVAPTVSPPDGLGVKVQVRMTNDGGWCAVTANRNGTAFDSYLLVTRPTHGAVYAHHVGSYTRIDYEPDPGFAGTDSFAVHMIPGDATVEETVTVSK
jgi:hypothetical protein